jgi:hypothetical protein
MPLEGKAAIKPRWGKRSLLVPRQAPTGLLGVRFVVLFLGSEKLNDFQGNEV